MANVHLHLGTARSERRGLLLERLAQAGDGGRMLVPTTRLARALTETALRAPGAAGWIGARIQPFQNFARELLRGTAFDLPLIPPLEQRLLLREAVRLAERDSKLGEFAEAAPTDGFLTHIHRVIAQLKQEALRPEDFEQKVLANGTAEPRDRTVAAIYRHYQELLQTRGWIDQQGLYWLAELACAESPPPGVLARTDTLVLEGFDDFTPSEFRLLKAAAPHLTELHFGLARDAERTTQQDLYELVITTQREIEKAFGIVAAPLEERAPENLLDYVEAHLFWRDPPPKPLDGGDVRFQPCRDPQHELEWCAREIKRLCRNGVAAGDIAVVARDWSGFGRRVRGVFEEMGVPIRFGEAIPLAETGAGSFILTLLELAPDWMRERVVDVLTSPYYRPDGIPLPHARLFGEIARTAYIHEGLDSWRKGLERLAKRFDKDGDERSLLMRLPERREAVAALSAEVERLNALFGQLPNRKAPLRDHAAAVLELLKGVGLRQASPEEAVEAGALSRAGSALGVLMRWDDARPLEPDEALLLIRNAIAHEQVTPEAPPSGIAVLNLEQARHLRWRHVFLLRANQELLPAGAGYNAIYSGDDAKRLSRSGVRLRDPRTHLNREMLLFHRALQAAGASLTLVWSERSSDGRTLLPSPFVRDVYELVTGNREGAMGRVDDAFELPADRLACLRDAVMRYLPHAEHAPPALRATLADASARAAIERNRFVGTSFNRYDGIVEDPDNLAAIAKDFGPDRVFSVSQLETYIDCPFRYFQERVLGVETPEAPDPNFDPRTRGLILHRALEDFFRGLGGRALPEWPVEEADARLDAALDAAFADMAWQGQAHPGFERAERLALGALLHAYVRRARANWVPGWTPAHFEASFGPGRMAARPNNRNPEHFALELPDGSAVLLAGQIDRIDLTADGTMARILDYKTGGGPSQGDMVAGRSLQLTLYALALEQHLLPGSECAEAYFVNLSGEKDDEALKKRNVKSNSVPWAKRLDNALAGTQAALAALRAGRFHPRRESEACDYCPHQRACRFQRARIALKDAP